MSHSVPDSQTIADLWQAVKDRSIPLKPLTKAEYDVLDETSKAADVAYLVQSADGLSLIYKEEILSGGSSTLSSGYLVNAPIGAIMIWSGSEDTIPEGWSICNGQNGTVDLRDKFVLAAGENHAIGETGGSETVTLTTKNIPSHTHPISVPVSGSLKRLYTSQSSSGAYNTFAATAFTKSGSGPVDTGSAGYPPITIEPCENMPPYYTALYIQKIGDTPSDYATVGKVEEIVEEALTNTSTPSGVPTGSIVIWSGSEDDIPDGWALCDGEDGRPNMPPYYTLCYIIKL